MRVPLKWLGEYVELPKNQDELTNGLTLIGHLLDKKETVRGDTVIDLELRGNRADCYSIFGIAREVSSYFGKELCGLKLYPKLKATQRLGEVTLTPDKKQVERVMMSVIRDIKLTSSPKWLRERLAQYGIASINNIVDLTNYVMLETGQPMHAFDLAKLGKALTIRLAKKGEVLETLHGTKISLTEEDLVWADETGVLSLAGAIGGKEKSIGPETRDILLEAAKYERTNIRRTIHRHNLFTDAGIRHEKELDANLVEVGIYRFLHLLSKNKWGKIENQVYDYYPVPVLPRKLTLKIDNLNKLAGTSIDQKIAAKILASLKFVVRQRKGELLVTIPTFRTDVTLEEDLIEEVIRIYGYDKVPAQTFALPVPEDITPDYIKQEDMVRNLMHALSFSETISLPFVNEKSLAKNIQVLPKKGEVVKVLNRPSHDIEFLRLSMLPSLWEKAKKVIHERGDTVRMFEVGKTYCKRSKDYIEDRKVGIIYWRDNAEFSEFKGFIEAFFIKLDINGVYFVPEKVPGLTNSYFIQLGKEVIGAGGKIDDMYFVEINLDLILGKEGKPKAMLWPKYPPQIEDMTIEIPEGRLVGEVIQLIKQASKLVSSVELVDQFERKFTFRIKYQHPEKTLSDKEVEWEREKILKAI